jgi:hypothetical protein
MNWSRITPRHRYKHTFTAWAITGARAGSLLGILAGIIITTSIFYAGGFTYYDITLAVLAILVSIAIGFVSGLLVGMLNGAVLGLMWRTDFFRTQVGIMKGRVSIVTALTTGLGGLVVLYVLFKGDALFVYPPTIIGALLATWLGRELPPIKPPVAEFP